jgi:hypothetical protein
MQTPLHRQVAEPSSGGSTHPRPELRVIHPLDDHPEAKRSLSGGTAGMRMSRTVKWWLGALRAYLVLITVLVIIRFVQLAAGHA